MINRKILMKLIHLTSSGLCTPMKRIAFWTSGYEKSRRCNDIVRRRLLLRLAGSVYQDY